MSEIVVVKLITGEEIIGDRTGETSSEVTLESPLLLQLKLNPESGNIGFGFLPYSPLTEDVKTFRKQDIMHTLKPKDILLNAYKQLTGRVIAPSKELIIG